MAVTFERTQFSERGDLFFVGDCILDPHFLSNPISDSLANIIRDSRLAVANLEAPIESNSRIKKVGPVKSTSEKGIESLASISTSQSILG